MPFDTTTYHEPLTETEQEAKDDLFRWLDMRPNRVPALLAAVRNGRLSWAAPCGAVRCVLGHLFIEDDWGALEPAFNAAGLTFPDDQFIENAPIVGFIADGRVERGDTPSNSPVMAHLERWILEWMG